MGDSLPESSRMLLNIIIREAKMAVYKYIRNLWKKPDKNIKALQKERLQKWRKEPATIRLKNPTRLDRARSLGYKAKQGYLVVRQRVVRGGRMRARFAHGRRPKHFRRVKIVGKNYQWVAEERAQKKFVNTEVLNSYWVGDDGRYYWYEVILIDKNHPVIKKSKELSWITEPAQTGRVYRGKTSAGRKARGLRKKGIGAEKIRPSQRANKRRAK